MHWQTFYRLREQAALSAEKAFGGIRCGLSEKP
jgi:hypothetical protein